MALTFEQCSRIMSPGRQLEVQMDVWAEDSWCPLHKPFAYKHPHGEGDAGVLRMLAPPKLHIDNVKSTGHFQATPVTLQMRNDDGWWNWTVSRYVVTADGVQKTLDRLKHAKVRFRYLDKSDVTADPAGIAFACYYIGRIRTQGAIAKVTYQPLEQRMMKVSPQHLKEANRWFRDMSAGQLIKRLVEHADPDVVWESGSPPSVVEMRMRSGYAGNADSSTWAIGVDTCNMGRQPETTGGELTFDRSKIITCICKDKLNPNVIYYAATEQTGKSRIYKYRISTGNSELLYTGNDDYPIYYMVACSSIRLLFVELGNKYPDEFDGFNRKATIYTMKTDGTELAQIVPSRGLWSCADAFIHAFPHTPTDATSSIGFDHPTDGRVDGEHLSIGFPQEANSILSDFSWFDLPRSYHRLRQDRGVPTYGNEGAVANARQFYDHTGWTRAQSENYPFAAYMHWNPFPFPAQYIESLNKVCYMYWDAPGDFSGEGNHWRFARRTPGGSSVTVRIAFPETGDNTRFRQYQPTGWCILDVDGHGMMGTKHWAIVATVFYEQSGRVSEDKNTYRSALWALDLDSAGALDFSIANSNMILIYESAPADDSTAPWPVFLDMCTAVGGDSWPGLLVGCYFCRHSGTYGVFMFSLYTYEMWLRSNTFPVSSSPFTGFVSFPGGTGTSEEPRCYFRDCGSGMLYEMTDFEFRIPGIQMPVNNTDTWESCPKLCLIPGAAEDLGESMLFGAVAPGPPMTAWPKDGNNIPFYPMAGSCVMWRFGHYQQTRIPIADFRPDLIKTTQQALEYIAQLCGPTWLFGYSPITGEFQFKERNTDIDATLVPLSEYAVFPSEGEIAIIGDIVTDDEEEEDVQNDIVVTPWEPVVPGVGMTMEMSPRRQDDPQLAVTPTPGSLKDSAANVTLSCIRAGVVGRQDYSVLTDFDENWDTGLLFSIAINAEDIVTETAQICTNWNTVVLKGAAAAPGGNDRYCLINGVAVYRTLSPFGGDWITVGKSAIGRIFGISLGGAMPGRSLVALSLSNMGTFPGATIPKGTVVTIRRRQHRGTLVPQAGGGSLIIQDISGTTPGEKETGVAFGDLVHVGNVIQVENELCLVISKRPHDDPLGNFIHYITVQRGYLNTEISNHVWSIVAAVYLHPRDSLAHPIADTGLTIAFAYDEQSDPRARSFANGDRIILDFPGTKAEPCKYNLGIASDAESISHYGKTSWKIDKNPFIGARAAPHVAKKWLAETAWPRAQLTVTTPVAPEFSPDRLLTVRSARALPSYTDNQVQCWLKSIDHDFWNRFTKLALVQDLSGAGGDDDADEDDYVGKDAGIGTRRFTQAPPPPR